MALKEIIMFEGTPIREIRDRDLVVITLILVALELIVLTVTHILWFH